MKKNLFSTILLALLLCSCELTVSVSGKPYRDYDDYDYDVGETTLSTIPSIITIDWAAGDITLKYHDQDTLVVEEKSRHLIKNSLKLRYYYDESDDELKIRFCKSKCHYDSDFTKDLTIYIPQNAELKLADINMGAGNVDFIYIACKNTDINMGAGDINLKLIGDADFVETDSGAGNVSIVAEYVKSIETDTAAGNTTIKCTREAPKDIETDAAAGKTTIIIPDNDGFTLKCSGLIKNLTIEDFACTVSDKKYVYLDGTKRNYNVSFATGSAVVKQYKD